MPPDFSDFDRYCDEHGITEEEAPAAFAAWLHERTGWDGPMEQAAEAIRKDGTRWTLT